MSVSTAISRITGFIRIGAMAAALGNTFFASSYQAANNLPNLIYELVAGGVLSSMFIPIFLEQIQREGDESASHLASTVFNLTMIALGGVALIATLWPYPFIKTQMWSLPASQLAEAMFLFRFFAIQVVFYGAAIIVTGMLNAKRHFLAPALGPVFNNVVVITTLIAYIPISNTGNVQLAHIVLAVGTTLGVVAQMVTALVPLRTLGFAYFPEIDLNLPAVRKMGRKMLPLVAYVAVNAVGLSARNSFATKASPNGIASLFYAWVFYQLPYGVLAVALATAFFPEISESANDRDWHRYRQQFAQGLRANALLIIPSAAMLIALSTPLLSLLVRQQFTLADVPATAQILAAWAAGLFSFTAYMFTVRGFYALQDTRTPATTNTVLTLTVQIGLYAALTLGVLGWPGIGLVGIPVADAVFYTVHFLVLLVLLRKRVGGFNIRSIAWVAARVVVASVVGAWAAATVVGLTPQLSQGLLRIMAQLLLGATAGLAVTFFLAWVFRVRELAIAGQMFRRYVSRLLPWTA
jgi:putative peptidoglycan lipid II flippase